MFWLELKAKMEVISSIIALIIIIVIIILLWIDSRD